MESRNVDGRYTSHCHCCRAALISQFKVSTCGISEQCCASDYPSRSDSSDAEWHTSALFTPLVTFLKANLSLVNFTVTAYPIPFYCLVRHLAQLHGTRLRAITLLACHSSSLSADGILPTHETNQRPSHECSLPDSTGCDVRSSTVYIMDA